MKKKLIILWVILIFVYIGVRTSRISSTSKVSKTSEIIKKYDTISEGLDYGLLADEEGEKGNYDEAIKLYDKAIEFSPEIGVLYASRGTAKFEKLGLLSIPRFMQENVRKQLDDIITDYDIAINLKSKEKYTVFHNLLARNLTGDKNFVKSIDSFVYYRRGFTKMFLSDFYGANKDFDKSLEIYPTSEWKKSIEKCREEVMPRHLEVLKEIKERATSVKVQNSSEENLSTQQIETITQEPDTVASAPETGKKIFLSNGTTTIVPY